MIGYVAGLIVISIVLSFYMKKDIVYIIPMCVLSSIAILYAFGIANALMMGVYALYAIAIFGVIFFAYTAIKYKKEFFKSISFTFIIIFAVFVLISLWAHWGRKISIWDELSHWGRVVKDMVYNNKFGTHPDSMVFFQNYPPANAVLQYLFIKIRGSFVEAEMYHAMNIIYFSLMMPLFKDIKTKKTLKIAAIVLIVLVLPTGFFSAASLYVDGLLGIYFGYILTIYFTKKFSKFNFINIALALFALALTKPSGVGIAALAAFVIYIDFIFVNRGKTKEYFNHGRRTDAIICILMPIIFLIIAKVSWSMHLDIMDAEIKFDTAKITMDKINNVFLRFNGTETQNQVMLNYLRAFTTTWKTAKLNYNISLPPVTFIILFMLMGAKFLYSEKDIGARKRILVTGISLLFVGVVYFVTLLFGYVFLFSDTEALGLASYKRYIGTYLLGIIMFLIAYILHKSKNDKEIAGKMPKYLLVLFVLMIVTVLESLFSITVLAPFDTKATALSRARFEDIQSIDEVVDEDDRVYLIHIGSTGFTYWVCSYNVYPINISGPISIGQEPYYGGDMWTEIITPDEWEENLYNDFDYVYIHETGYDFGEKYGHLFGGEENVLNKTLYYIDKLEGNVILTKAER